MFGEDPTLTATLVVESVNGIQSQQVVATAKHYIDNDQEYVYLSSLFFHFSPTPSCWILRGGRKSEMFGEDPRWL
jgi:hypothetical protein